MDLLVISLAGIGDTLFATPLVHELRANFPQARIDALVLWPGSKSLLEGNPHLNRVYQKNLIKARKPQALKFLWDLRKRRYDISINTHPQSRIHYRLVARVIGASTRVSHEYDNSLALDRFLVNRTIKQDYERHSVENNLSCLDLIGAKQLLPRHDYEIHLSPADSAWAGEFIAAHDLKERLLLGIHVGSGGTKNLALRRWPLDAYVELITRICREHPNTTILLFGGPEEEKDHQRVLAQTDRRFVLEPRTGTLLQAAALLKHCQLFLSVDTALMHVAAAMKVPKQIIIETPTWNTPIQPYNNPFMLVKNPAVAGRNLEFYRYDGRGIRGSRQQLMDCMASVSVDAVYETITTAIAGLGKGSGASKPKARE